MILTFFSIFEAMFLLTMAPNFLMAQFRIFLVGLFMRLISQLIPSPTSFFGKVVVNKLKSVFCRRLNTLVLYVRSEILILIVI